MSENLRKVIEDLHFVSRIKCQKTKKNILKYLTKYPNYYKAFIEISKNLVALDVKPGNLKKKISKPDRLKIIKLAKSKNTNKNKKIIVQSGGWLWIIPIVIDIIKSL